MITDLAVALGYMWMGLCCAVVLFAVACIVVDWWRDFRRGPKLWASEPFSSHVRVVPYPDSDE